MHPSKHPHFPGSRQSPPWQKSRHFFLPFAIVFGGLTLLFVIGISIFIYLVITHQAGKIHDSRLPLLFCAVPIIFVFIASMIGRFTFRRFGRPMAEIFSAIDSISGGDLSIRVSEHYPREFGQLARRFNHMTAELERADTRRRNLTNDIAHELRNPLHIIQGNLEGMLDGIYEPTPENINNILDETRLLARLVNDLQTISLAEAGQLLLHPTHFLLIDLINDLISSFSSQAKSLNIDLISNISDPTLSITADYDRIDQVLSNLMANAIRHTPSGGSITLTTGQAKEFPGGIRIEVKDTGSGIPADDLPYIFDRFWRGDRSRSERVNSGLGLAIARQLVHAHKGTITVESAVGAGSVFVIELPHLPPTSGVIN